jgi:transcriptional regulator with XRE-family HTH domain
MINEKTHEPRKRGQKIPASEIDRLIGIRIRVARNMSGKKQEDLANYLGLTLQQTQKYENGKNKISVNILTKISEYFNIPISYFIPSSVGSNQENTINTLQMVNMDTTLKVAEDWKPISPISNKNNEVEEFNEKEQQELIIQIIDILTKISDPRKQRDVIKFLKDIQKK